MRCEHKSHRIANASFLVRLLDMTASETISLKCGLFLLVSAPHLEPSWPSWVHNYVCHLCISILTIHNAAAILENADFPIWIESSFVEMF